MQNEPDPSGPDDSTADLGANTGNNVTFDQAQAMAAGIENPQVGDEYQVTIKIGDTSAGVSAQILDGSAVKAGPSGDANNVGEPDETETNAPDADDEDESASTPPLDSLAVKPAPKKKQRVVSPADLGISMTSGLD